MKLKTITIGLILAGCGWLQSCRFNAANDGGTGPIISEIDFKLKATKADTDVFTDGIIPWINIENPNKQLDSLIDADKIVLPFNAAAIIIDYPLRNPATFDISSTGKGFSRKDLILKISEKYHEIYKEEEQTSASRTLPANQRKGVINRNETNGKYGIWGHDLGDLDLDEIEVHKGADGKIYLVLGVES